MFGLKAEIVRNFPGYFLVGLGVTVGLLGEKLGLPKSTESALALVVAGAAVFKAHTSREDGK